MRALLSETARETALEAVREHAKSCRALRAMRPRFIVRDILVETLGKMMMEPDRVKVLWKVDIHPLQVSRVCWARRLQVVCSTASEAELQRVIGRKTVEGAIQIREA